MSIDQETRERIRSEMEEWFERLGDVSEEELFELLREYNPRVVRDPYYRPGPGAEPGQEDHPRRRDSASTQAAS